MDARMTRYSGIIDPEKISEADVTIVGVGAIGRQVAIQLASMGIGSLKIIDFDIVDEVNLGPQGWMAEDVDLEKVDALKDLIGRINPSCRVSAENRRYNKGTDRGDKTVFCCADSMSVRKLVFESGKFNFFGDARMSAESFRAFSATPDNGGLEYYPTTLFRDEDAEQAPCTARSTIYCSNVVAGVLVSLYMKHLRGFDPEKEVMMSVLGSWMYAA